MGTVTKRNKLIFFELLFGEDIAEMVIHVYGENDGDDDDGDGDGDDAPDVAPAA